jgi:hypothetical protein
MTRIQVQPDRLHVHADAYARVVARVERTRDELLATIARCEHALGREVQDTMTELRWSLQHGLDVLAHDHRQVQAGLAAVSGCYRELDQGLFR